MTNDIKKCNKLTGGTLHSIETKKYITDDHDWSENEIDSRYKCNLTGKPCIGRIAIEKVKDWGMGPEKWYQVRLNKEIQKRCPLYDFDYLSAVNLTSAILQNCREGTNEELEKMLNTFFLDALKETNKKED